MRREVRHDTLHAFLRLTLVGWRCHREWVCLLKDDLTGWKSVKNAPSHAGDADSGTIAAGQQSDHLVMAAAVQQWLLALRGPGGRKVGLLLCPTGQRLLSASCARCKGIIPTVAFSTPSTRHLRVSLLIYMLTLTRDPQPNFVPPCSVVGAAAVDSSDPQ